MNQKCHRDFNLKAHVWRCPSSSKAVSPKYKHMAPTTGTKDSKAQDYGEHFSSKPPHLSHRNLNTLNPSSPINVTLKLNYGSIVTQLWFQDPLFSVIGNRMHFSFRCINFGACRQPVKVDSLEGKPYNLSSQPITTLTWPHEHSPGVWNMLPSLAQENTPQAGGQRIN